MRKRLLVALTPPLLLLTLAAAAGRRANPQGPPPPPPMRKIPGVTAADTFSGGCVACHTNRPDLKLDARLSTALKGMTRKVEPAILRKAQAAAPGGLTLKGRHPAISAGLLKNIPAGCAACHAKSSKTAPPLAPMVHLLHLTGGEKNHFMTLFQGECTHCHKLNPATGQWSVPSGPER